MSSRSASPNPIPSPRPEHLQDIEARTRVLHLADDVFDIDDDTDPAFDLRAALSQQQPEADHAVPTASEISVAAPRPKHYPPPLKIIPPKSSPTVKDSFEDVKLSPPHTPLVSAGLAPYHVPLPFSPTPPRSPTPNSFNFTQPMPMRPVSPRPNYLSPESSIPVPHDYARSPSPVSPTQISYSRPDAPAAALSSGSLAVPHHSPSRSTSSSGPSLFEKVMSKTRPSYLPPKTREEDKKHMRDWEEMMKKSRQAEDKKQQELRASRLSKESAAEDALARWEREVMPDWKSAVRKPEVRKMWWGGIPTKLRSKLWILAVGNGLALSKDTFNTCLARAQRALATQNFPEDSLRLLEDDILHTLPNLHIFHPEYGPMYQDLKNVLCAWVVSRSDEGLGYVRGASSIAAMFVLNMPPDQAFIAMRNLLERHCMRSFYGGDSMEDDLEAYYRIFDTLLADGMPKVYFNFKQHQISPSLYLPSWIIPLFLNHLPFEACARIWDVCLLEGDSFMFRMAIAVLGVLESRLFFPDKKELLEVLRGENKAALEVAKRTGVSVDLSARYEQYGMSEVALWQRISEMDEWWRESTWQRLIQRELPDL